MFKRSSRVSILNAAAAVAGCHGAATEQSGCSRGIVPRQARKAEQQQLVGLSSALRERDASSFGSLGLAFTLSGPGRPRKL